MNLTTGYPYWLINSGLPANYPKLDQSLKEKKSVTVEPIDLHHLYISNAKADDYVELLFIIIQALKDIDKAIVVLHLEGYQNKEIAEILNMSPTNVDTRFNRVKSQLKMKFNNEYHAAKQS